MAQKLTTSFLSYTASASTEASGYSVTNITDKEHPKRHWRSTVVTDSWVEIDLGSAQTDLTVYLDNVNFTSFKYQESSTSGGTFSDIGTTRTVEKDPVHGVYRRKDEITLSSKQYLRIFIPSQTPADSASYFKIGTFAIPTSITELNSDTIASYPFRYIYGEGGVLTRQTPAGNTEKTKLTNIQPLLIAADFSTAAPQNIKGAALEEVMDLVRDETVSLWVDWNLGQSWQSYICKRNGSISITLDSPNTGTLELGEFIFQVN